MDNAPLGETAEDLWEVFREIICNSICDAHFTLTEISTSTHFHEFFREIEVLLTLAGGKNQSQKYDKGQTKFHFFRETISRKFS